MLRQRIVVIGHGAFFAALLGRQPSLRCWIGGVIQQKIKVINCSEKRGSKVSTQKCSIHEGNYLGDGWKKAFVRAWSLFVSTIVTSYLTFSIQSKAMCVCICTDTKVQWFFLGVQFASVALWKAPLPEFWPRKATIFEGEMTYHFGDGKVHDFLSPKIWSLLDLLQPVGSPREVSPKLRNRWVCWSGEWHWTWNPSWLARTHFRCLLLKKDSYDGFCAGC